MFWSDARAAEAQTQTSAVLYTAWDDYYFYAGVQVNDPKVNSVNRTPISNPQQDDDVEVFFDTKPDAKSAVRTPDTYQMAVSAGSGAYFSVGDGTAKPMPKLVVTYKYAVTIDGTLNKNTDTDTGYTIELAIPWQEMGLSGPPSESQTWGFNVIARDRDSADTPAQSFISLSDAVKTGPEVQDPDNWTKIQFVNAVVPQASSSDIVYCPRIQTQFPVIDGVIRGGEWRQNFDVSFSGTHEATAPTADEEPNIKESPFAAVTPEVVQTPHDATADVPEYTITLPGGMTVRVGRTPTPQTPTPFIPEETPGSGPKHRPRHQRSHLPGSETDPLAIALPPGTQTVVGPDIDQSTASLALLPQDTVAPLLLAPYYYDYPSDLTGSTLLDQPMEGFGPTFATVAWNRAQLADARRAGVDVVLPVVDPGSSASASGLTTLVEALKEMRDSGQEYPLLGLRVNGDRVGDAINEFFTRVPRDFRAEVSLPDKDGNGLAYIVVTDTLPDTAALKQAFQEKFAERATLLITTPAGKDSLKVTTISPGGRDDKGALTGRAQTHTYAAAWQSIFDNGTTWVYLTSWNDYRSGTEVAASRQYGEQYADLTRLSTLQWSGQKQWDANYIQVNCPQTIAQKTIYTVPIRIENAGTLPWRVGEDYALCYRWYKDGRLYDDTAPRIPLSEDIYPGRATTVNVGVLAQNSQGVDLDPGDYTLVFDMVQGQDRWFTYTGDLPLKVPVRVVAPADAPKFKAVFLTSSAPSVVSDRSYPVSLTFRNDGQTPLAPETTKITVAVNGVQASALLSAPVPPGAPATVSTTLPKVGDLSAVDAPEVVWAVSTPDGQAEYHERVISQPLDTGASFTINDIPRKVKTGETFLARIGVANNGSETWTRGKWRVGYRWLYLDGVPAYAGGKTSGFQSDVLPGSAAATNLNVKAPDWPGRYQVIFDVQDPQGQSGGVSGRPLLPILVSVSADKSARAVPVDLAALFDTDGIGFEGDSSGDLDGSGDAFPGEMLPPDGTTEADANPLLIGKPGPAYYPSGYYSQQEGDGLASNHHISFLYPPKTGNTVITCKGQTVDLPDGSYSVIHLLAAATGGAPVAGQFGIGYREGITTQDITFADWSQVPDDPSASVGYRSSYRLKAGAIDASAPAVLGDYRITLNPDKHLSRLALPTDSKIKIFAITLEK